MSKKRVFDKDLGVELVLDEETDDELSGSGKNEQDNEQTAGRGRKKAKFEPSSIGRYSNQPQPAQNPSTPSDSENYEDIDYGDDDDDEAFQQKEQNDLIAGTNTPLTSKIEKLKHENGTDDEVSLPRDMEENADDEQEGGEEDGNTGKEPAEKCKYWPSCTAGDNCNYYHPAKPCRAFPNCRFGRKCLFIHPPCKFNPHCAKPSCPYAHSVSTVRRAPPNLFRKPILCRFGANCLLETCPYTHPSDVVRKKPASAFRWSAQSD